MINLSKLSEAINEQLILHDLTEQALSEQTGIPVSCISLYVRGKQAPYLDTLVKLADFFNCSVDFLLGRADVSASNFQPCPPFSERLNELLKTYTLPKKLIFESTGISKSSFYAWKRGECVPTLDNVIRLSKLFNCSVDFVLGREA